MWRTTQSSWHRSSNNAAAVDAAGPLPRVRIADKLRSVAAQLSGEPLAAEIDAMRTNTKLFVLGVSYLLGGLGLFAYSMLHWPDGVTIALSLLWFAAFAAAQFLLIRCSQCGWPLLLAKRGRAVLPIGWIPAQCYRCHANTQARTGG